MMIFEGDYVRLTSEHVFLRVEEVLADDIVRLEDGFNVLASSMFIQEVKSADEYAELEAQAAVQVIPVTQHNYGTIPTGYDLVISEMGTDPFADGFVVYGWDELDMFNWGITHPVLSYVRTIPLTASKVFRIHPAMGA